jgi:hypothetical protein
MARYKLLAWTNPAPGKEAEFNDWYDRQHVPDILAVPGIVDCQRFRVAVPSPVGETKWKYVAMYDVDSEQPAQIFQEMIARMTDGRMVHSDSMGPDNFAVIVEPLGPVRTR